MKEVDLTPDVDPKSAECIKKEQEIRVLRKLKHRNIVQYYGSEIMEDVFAYIWNTAYCIRAGLRHSNSSINTQDIKEQLPDASGVLLADFGLAKHVLSSCATDLSLKGSPHWMAPEVLQAVLSKDNPELALAVDIWSSGLREHSTVAGFSEDSSVMKLRDTLQSPKNSTNHKKEQKSLFPGTSARHGKSPCSSETCQQTHPETSEYGAASHHFHVLYLKLFLHFLNGSELELTASPQAAPSSFRLGPESRSPYRIIERVPNLCIRS
ncbi:hypothetical protein HAX54_043686 [Datura stramonium]|uniref:Protein kinase domain-containing protein n=1 Tax=Datura stramonium TaxID=4076 RepID=A0ABS8SNG6_DATST|nr:hypothetical protein [Datura stramonium]